MFNSQIEAIDKLKETLYKDVNDMDESEPQFRSIIDKFYSNIPQDDKTPANSPDQPEADKENSQPPVPDKRASLEDILSRLK